MNTKSLYQKKQKALQFFTQKVLNTQAGKDVARIILFGSLAQGKIDQHSDIDVAIFAKRPEKIEGLVDEITYEILLNHGEDIDPLIYPLSDFKKPRSYFTWQIVNQGQSVYP